VTDDIVDRYREYHVEAISGTAERRREEAWVREAPFPAAMPPYQAIRVDGLGHIWLEQYRAPWDSEPQWWVFDPEGRWLGEVSTPVGFRIDEIGPDYLLGVRRDEYSVEHVTMYGLQRGG
jgi:hypothetical protein